MGIFDKTVSTLLAFILRCFIRVIWSSPVDVLRKSPEKAHPAIPYTVIGTEAGAT